MRYTAKKLAMMLLTMVIVSFLAFLAFQIIPGDPTVRLLGTDATAESVALLRAELGLDRPFFVRYAAWMQGALQGDFGRSYSYAMPVSELLAGKIGITALLTAVSFLLIVTISLPAGILLCAREHPRLDRAADAVNQLIMAIPPFFTGILMTLVFGLMLRWFVPGSFVSPSEDFWRSAAYLVFPALAIALPRIAMTVKMLRASVRGELTKDYVRTAYSRGNSRWQALCRHVLRNAVVPTVAFLAMTAADLVAGSVVIEQVFSVPGLGRLLLTSIANRDFPVVQAIVVILALWVVLVNGAADLLNQRLDPRLRLS